MIAENDALPLEYKLMYGSARRHLSLNDIVDDASLLGESNVLGGGFEKQPFNLVVSELPTTAKDLCDLGLVRLDTV